MALGTDGPASNNALDMFREMYLVTGLQKILSKDPVSIPAFEVLKMATVNGAMAMNLPNARYLDEGQLADIIMIDLKRPSMQPINNIINNIVYSGSKDCVKMTMINGKILYYNGEFLIDEKMDDIYRKAQELAEELKVIKEEITIYHLIVNYLYQKHPLFGCFLFFDNNYSQVYRKWFHLFDS